MNPNANQYPHLQQPQMPQQNEGYQNLNVNNDTNYPMPPQPVNDDSTNSDIVIGITQKEERARTYSLVTMINTEAYAEEDYGTPYIVALKINNFVYKYTYLIFGFLFAILLGTFMSFATGIATACLEFLNLFSLRPTLKMLAIVMQSVKSIILLIAQAVAPLFELIFPGTFKNWGKKEHVI
eukprot:TRINITY_DN80489_c0_g1_i1.p1 TRINITY_DN80489_c0_g1~~TRINITY_DN80489_c0_g1_i1.p1  ORF type:complete len:200 (+),score=29.53 TRINITY_DN80489_c0_g1_i1:60-602(+)